MLFQVAAVAEHFPQDKKGKQQYENMPLLFQLCMYSVHITIPCSFTATHDHVSTFMSVTIKTMSGMKSYSLYFQGLDDTAKGGGDT